MSMKTFSHSRPARRHLLRHARRRLKRRASLWMARRRRGRPTNGTQLPARSREDQIIIDVLRFRLAHPGAVSERQGAVVYSAAFRAFIVQRYAQEREHFTRRQFAHAAEIEVATLRDWWLAAAPEFEAAAPPVPAAASAGEAPAAGVPARARLRFARAFLQWAHALFQTEVFEIYSLTDYGRQELRKIYRKNIARGLAIAAALHIAGIIVYWSTLEEGESLKTVTLLKYVEIEPKVIPEEPRVNRKRAGGGSAESAAPGSPAPGQPGPVPVPDNFIPMAAIEQLKEIAQLGRPSRPGLAPPQHITSSLHASTLPELDIGSIGLSDDRAPDYQSPSGIGLPSASALGSANGYGSDLRAATVGYGGGMPGGTGAGGSGGGGGYGYGRGGGGSGSGSGPGRGAGTGLKSAVERKGQAPPENKVEIKPQNLETVDLNKVFQELLAWLKSHQTELSPVLKHYLRYRPGDLTGEFKIDAAPVKYDLFILCNEHSQDIGILLAEEGSGEAIMLRDTGFRKKSFYLSKGMASRDEDMIVSSLTMLENSPTRAETSKFYDIFLSWWENNKNR